MSRTNGNKVLNRTEEVVRLDTEIAEVTLLLFRGQVAALENLARQRSLTVGQLLRCLVRDYLARENHHEPTPAAHAARS